MKCRTQASFQLHNKLFSNGWNANFIDVHMFLIFHSSILPILHYEQVLAAIVVGMQHLMFYLCIHRANEKFLSFWLLLYQGVNLSVSWSKMVRQYVTHFRQVSACIAISHTDFGLMTNEKKIAIGNFQTNSHPSYIEQSVSLQISEKKWTVRSLFFIFYFCTIIDTQEEWYDQWSILSAVLQSLLQVGKLYCQQGCVREAECYLHEGLVIANQYLLPRR